MAELDELRAKAEALGVKVDGRWGADRIRAAISGAQLDDDEPANADESSDVDIDERRPDEPEPVAEQQTGQADELPAPIRAGGHVNYGDGRGWVLDTEE